jgi:GNAT superfamily N-acetyltransferase
MITSTTQVTAKNFVLFADNTSDIASCFPVFQELRPELRDREAFIAQVLRQNREGYTLCYVLEDDEIASCMGFRMYETLGWGKILYIDDLITREKSRKKGFGHALVEYALEKARHNKCSEVHLDSGHHRNAAHRFYLNLGFTLSHHHFSLKIKDN